MACTDRFYFFCFLKAQYSFHCIIKYTTHRILQLNDASITPRWAKHLGSFHLLPYEAGNQETKPFHIGSNPIKGLSSSHFGLCNPCFRYNPRQRPGTVRFLSKPKITTLHPEIEFLFNFQQIQNITFLKSLFGPNTHPSGRT
jgi:hypothetical protein